MASSPIPDEESAPAPVPARDGQPRPPTGPISISRALTIRLYTSHFLSTWNSRLFEAGVVYFLASIFPDNLLPISIYALLRNAAAIALTNMDRSRQPPDHSSHFYPGPAPLRCRLVRSILGSASAGGSWPSSRSRSLCGNGDACLCREVLAGMNLVSVERDWLVVITEGNETARRKMNARMRRIDLFCPCVQSKH
ncbi:hypothetical protein F4779DRAFT_356549 [Xylariaceae sp. FL0662B]|nr:hypothetical protein F4779DRAFT_356549 [Xylariaceae sp. FL0662B]